MRTSFDLLRQRDMVRIRDELDNSMRSVDNDNSYEKQQQLASFMLLSIQELNNEIHEEIRQNRIKEDNECL